MFIIMFDQYKFNVTLLVGKLLLSQKSVSRGKKTDYYKTQ